MKKPLHLKNIEWHARWLIYDLFKGIMNRLGLFKSYNEYWIKRRKGRCKSCANCCGDICRGMSTGLCEQLDFKTKKCKVYRTRLYYAKGCHKFPRNPLVARLDNCQGYAFRKGSFWEWIIKRK